MATAIYGNQRSGDQLTISATKDSLIIAPANPKIVEVNERTITASVDSRDQLRQRSRRDRRDSPDQPHLEEVQPRLEAETGLVCRAGRRRLEERTIPRGLGNTPC